MMNNQGALEGPAPSERQNPGGFVGTLRMDGFTS